MDRFNTPRSRKNSEKSYYAPPQPQDSNGNGLGASRWKEYAFTALVAWFFVSLYPIYQHFNSPHHRARVRADAYATLTKTVAAPPIQKTALPGSLSYTEYNPIRVNDAIDGFAHYKKTETCDVNSLDIHGPFEPLCQDQASLLDAMTSGGRLGFDAPFSPKGCDMRWFSDDEICDIFSRFEKVIFIGDSMMRNVATAMSIYMRRDLKHGGRATWYDPPDGLDCTCNGVFDTSKCTEYSSVGANKIWEEDPLSMYCPPGMANGFEYTAWHEYPIEEERIFHFYDYMDIEKPKRPYALVYGHGLWNDLEIEKTRSWLDQVRGIIFDRAPWMRDPHAYVPQLFVGPNAAGTKKPEIFVARQGNIALTKFEHAVKPFVNSLGIDFVGTYNATIQTNNPDGTHGGMKNNLLRAMMVLNWLNTVDVSKHKDSASW